MMKKGVGKGQTLRRTNKRRKTDDTCSWEERK